MCVCVCIHLNVHMQVRMHTHTHTHARTHTRTHLFIRNVTIAIRKLYSTFHGDVHIFNVQLTTNNTPPPHTHIEY